MLIAKELIRPGTYSYLGPDGKPRKLAATRQFIDHLHRSGVAMLRAGLSIPVPVEHQPDAVPMTQAQKAAKQLRENSGWVHNFFRRGDSLYANLDIQDPAIFSRLPKTIRFTSPHINSFVDGSGRQWDGVISHVALTSRPRIVPQEPFPSIAAALSLLPAEAVSADRERDIDLSLAGLLVRRAGAIKTHANGLTQMQGATWEPLNAAAFSVWSGIKLADDEGRPEPKDKMDKEPPEVPESKDDIPPGQDTTQGVPGVDADGDISIYKVVCDMLGVDSPQGANEMSCMEAIYKHLMEKMKGQGGAAPMSDTMNQPNTGSNDLPPNPPVQEQQPLYMSMEQINAIPDAALRTTAQAAAAVLRNRLNEYGVGRQQRIERLAKKLPSAKAKEMLLSLAKTTPTLSVEGNIIDPAGAMLSVLEESVPDVPGVLVQTGAGVSLGRAAVEQGHPTFGGEPMTQEQADRVFNEFARNTGMQPPREPEDDVSRLANRIARKLSE